MSHLSTIKTKYKNQTTLEKVLREMECEVITGKNLQVDMAYRIDGNKHEDVDMIVNPNNTRGAKNFMGFKQSGEEFELLGDDYGTGMNMAKFNDEVKGRYAEEEVKEQFNLDPELSEFSLVKRELNEKGEVELTFERW